jgi:hypothetical protein
MSESSAASRRPRPALLVLLAVALGALVVYMAWPEAAKPPAPSNPSREQQRQTKGGPPQPGTPESLAVQLDALKQPPPAPDDASRNPFRFYVKPPPAPPPQAAKPVVTGPPPPPPPPPGPPPIPLKFIGTLEKGGRKVAIFVNTDGHGLPQYAGEGETVLGQYRVVKIGVESVTLEYLDGRGRQTIPMRG